MHPPESSKGVQKEALQITCVVFFQESQGFRKAPSAFNSLGKRLIVIAPKEGLQIPFDGSNHVPHAEFLRLQVPPPACGMQRFTEVASATACSPDPKAE